MIRMTDPRGEKHEVNHIFGSLACTNLNHGRRYKRMLRYRTSSLFILVLICSSVVPAWFLLSKLFPAVDWSLTGEMYSTARGRCGNLFPLRSGGPSKCDPSIATCCSPRGWCSSSPEDCLCDECVYYEWEEVRSELPEMIPLVDDNSEFNMEGYKHIILEPKIDCSSNILIVVYSAIHNFNYRHQIRMTWGNRKYLSQINASLIFVVGRYPNLKIQWRLELESRKYKDILQGDFFEDYFLLAYKSLTWLDWSKKKCSQIPWIVKTDDDMVNNIWKLSSLVDAIKYHKNTITCSTKTEKVLRQKTGTRIDKWVIPYDEWPDEYFPTNCWGVVYIMYNSVRDKLVKVFEESDKGIFRVDDVFITGMLAEKANVTHRDISDLITFYEDWDEEVLLTGNVWFGHVPPDSETLHKKRFWLWRRMLEHEFPISWGTQSIIDKSYL